MIEIFVAAILSGLLLLVTWEAAVLGIAWALGSIADVSINYLLIGGIVFGIWAILVAIQILYLIGTYREGKKIDKEVEERRAQNRKRMEELVAQERRLGRRRL